MSPERRLRLLAGGGLLLLLGLGLRLWQLSVLRHQELSTTALRRQRRVEVLPARRGAVLARDGRPLAIDLPIHDVVLRLTDLDPALDLVGPLALAGGIERQEALRLLRAARAGAAAGARQLPLLVVPLERAEVARRALRSERWLSLAVGEDGLHVGVEAAVFAPRAETLARLARLLERSPQELEAQVQAAVDAIHAQPDRSERVLLWQRPLVVVPEAGFAVVARVLERAFELPGVELRIRYRRRYPQGALAAHVVGTCGPPTAEELRRDAALLLDGDRDAQGLLLGAREEIDPRARLRDEPRGRSGVERSAQEALRGRPGARVLVRDARNQTRGVLFAEPPQDGADLRLSLDVDLQGPLEEALDRAVLRHGDPASGGAACVLDLERGDVLALATSPRYDPNTLGQDYPQLLADPRKPLLHRAVLAFAPGSTWKALSAFAITEPGRAGSLPPGWSTVCQGRAALGGNSFACDGVHMDVELVEALERSCNVFFFRAADQVGMEPLADWAARFGLGRRFGRGIPGEHAGAIPRAGEKRRRAAAAARAHLGWTYELARAGWSGDARRVELASRRLARARWWLEACTQDLELRPGDVRNAIIGQGDVLANPIQVAHLAAVVATGGRAPTPRLDLDAPVEVQPVALDPRVLERVRQGLRRVTTHGTASKAELGLRGLDVAGKTGTAERNARAGQPHQAWFMGYYPASRPRIAFAVLVDRTHGHGGDVCAPVARALIDAWRVTQGEALPRPAGALPAGARR